MKKKFYYVHLGYYENGIIAYPGVKKKIEAQLQIVENSGFEIHEVELQVKHTNKIVKRLPGISGLYDWENQFEKIVNPDIVYIRHVYLDEGYINFLRLLKNNFPKLVILVEIPTYPYRKERFAKTGIDALIDYPLKLKDLINSRKLYRYVDRIVTYTEDDEIFGIPTIKIQNGLDVSKIPVAIPRENGGYSLSDSSSLHTGVSRI